MANHGVGEEFHGDDDDDDDDAAVPPQCCCFVVADDNCSSRAPWDDDPRRKLPCVSECARDIVLPSLDRTDDDVGYRLCSAPILLLCGFPGFPYH